MADARWKYLICAHGDPDWDEFASEHGTWPVDIDSNRDFSACREVAEDIAKDAGLDTDVTLCMENVVGRRFEVDVVREEIVRYKAEDSRDMGARPTEAASAESEPAVEDAEELTDDELVAKTDAVSWRV